MKQRNAIDLLVTGPYDREVAEKIGVERETTTRWRLYDPDFRIELERARDALWGNSANKMRSLLPKALRVVDEGLEDQKFSSDRMKLALSVLKIAKLDFNSGSEKAEASETQESMDVPTKETGLGKATSTTPTDLKTFFPDGHF